MERYPTSLLIRFLSVFILVPHLFLGCASVQTPSLGGSTQKLDQIEERLSSSPTQQVDEERVREVSADFPAQEESLSAMTAEMFGKRVKFFFMRLVNLHPNEEAATESFAKGVDLFDRGDFEASAKELWIATIRWPDSPLQEDAIFLRAEAFFFANRYSKAQKEYERLLKKYDATRYLDRVSPRLFAIGQYWDKLDQANNYSAVVPNLHDKTRPTFSTFAEAIKAYKTITMHDPSGLWADHALMAAGNANYIRGEFVEASHCYDDLIKFHPQSRHLQAACELNLAAKLHMYEGPMYDDQPLNEADQLAERILSQFDSQLGPRKDEIIETRNRIVDARAERDIAFAQFYESKRQYASARFYYLQTMNTYPQTIAAQVARERYEKILEYPAEPPDYFSWLKVIFPEK
ncbi:MAG: outer membrane protein assembly factor BamD [Planctomycetia bacterium]|nr:outer membrane protein assembly factor BamD [Planctomycetia bacterium]